MLASSMPIIPPIKRLSPPITFHMKPRYWRNEELFEGYALKGDFPHVCKLGIKKEKDFWF
ncbi:MAG: hypothetical protein RXO22_08985 [Thermocladium sp.]